MIPPVKPAKTLITPAIVMAMLGYGILLTLFFNLTFSFLDYPSGTPAIYLLNLLSNLRDGIERPQLTLKIISLWSILIGSAVCLACYLNKRRMNLLRLIFSGAVFAGSIGCGLGREACALPIAAGLCFGLCLYCWKSYRPERQNESNLFRHAFPVMMRHPECLMLATGLLLLIITQTIALIFANEGNIGRYAAYPFLLLGRLLFLYALWQSGRKYKRYRFTFLVAGLSSVLSALDILCTQYLGIGFFVQWPRQGLYLVYLALDMAALACMWRNTKRQPGRHSIVLIGIYVLISFLLGLGVERTTLGLQLPLLVYSNCLVILGWILFVTDLYQKVKRPLYFQ